MNVSLANASKKYNSSQKWNHYKMKYEIKQYNQQQYKIKFQKKQ